MSSRADADTLFELSTPPTDGISKVKFFHASNRCVVSSWDRTVSIHELVSNEKNEVENTNSFTGTRKLNEYCHEAGVLDVAVSADDSRIFSVGCDYALRSFDVGSGSEAVLIGYHSNPIRCVEYCASKDLVITGSWDKTLKLWDVRNKRNEFGYELSDKVFSMSMQSGDGNNLIVGTADRLVYIFDIRKMDEYVQRRESSLKHQTRTIECHPNNAQYVLSSIEGRVAVEYLNPNKEWQTKKYAFKCHRQSSASSASNGAQQIIYPVNCVAFHPVYYTFATGGGDGVVNIWDGENKKRICQFPSLSTSIASIDFNKDADIIAVAKSYTWEKGDLANNNNNGNNEANPNIEKDTVIFRKVSDTQVKPKMKKKKAAQ